MALLALGFLHAVGFILPVSNTVIPIRSLYYAFYTFCYTILRTSHGLGPEPLDMIRE
ncbi:hypothetical protein K449DRAFT_55585 [Hypoxylon sp. EC38]|nr:hypothetical protein K449DRAFT_55585 [Hypoxylon sp. EC38]